MRRVFFGGRRVSTTVLAWGGCGCIRVCMLWSDAAPGIGEVAWDALEEPYDVAGSGFTGHGAFEAWVLGRCSHGEIVECIRDCMQRRDGAGRAWAALGANNFAGQGLGRVGGGAEQREGGLGGGVGCIGGLLLRGRE